ncbi:MULTISPECIES: LptE family protein [Acidobacterium]|uniref:LPS assembly lipoprotein LptE n=1 Tax=Acidobacterium TaxID=33973 RepID=UPI0005A003E0|nr:MULTISPECIES: LptE family protein [Acidobacterium]
MSRLALVLFSACLLPCSLWVSGCNYHAMDTPSHLPPSLGRQSAQTLAIPTFVNHTNAYHVGFDFTQAVIRQFTSRSAWHIVDHRDPEASATLYGQINSYSVVPLTYDNTTGRSSSFVITIKASLRVINRRGKVIYQNSSYTFRQQYEETQNLASFIQEDSPAEERLARDFASAAVSDILDSF